MSNISKQLLEVERIEEENGAGALRKQSPKEPRKIKHKRLHLMDADGAPHEDGEDAQQLLTPLEKSKYAMPPPPPPPTPVQAPPPSAAPSAPETDDEANSEKWEDPCAPPPPPPLPRKALAKCASYANFTAVKLKDALEEAITKMESNKREQQQQLHCSKVDSYVPVLDVLKTDAVIEMSQKCPTTTIRTACGPQALIVHPKCNRPALLDQLYRKMKVGKLLAKQSSNVIISREPIPLPATAHDDEGQGLMALQVLSARASTPYTQPTSQLSCTAVSCDLHLSPPLETGKTAAKKHLPAAPLQEQPRPRSISSAPATTTARVGKLRGATQSSAIAVTLPSSRQHYTRNHLLEIRNAMMHALIHRSKESLTFSMPRIATCDDIEMEARLRRMNLWRSTDAITRGTQQHSLKLHAPRLHHSHNPVNNNNNECMPAFFKNKTKQQQTDDSIIQTQPPQSQAQSFQDPAIVNLRRIGSGRLSNTKWPYNNNNDYKSYNNNNNYQANTMSKCRMDVVKPHHHNNNNNSNMTVMKFFDNGEISTTQLNGAQHSNDRPNTPIMGMSNNNNSNNNNRSENESLKSNESIEDLNRANENYVKRVMSGFLVVSKTRSREAEERHYRRYRNQNEEPEWFSCGPTSRLDTIELCGFDEDEERMLKEGSHTTNEINREPITKHKIEHNKHKTQHRETLGRNNNNNINNSMSKHDSNNNSNISENLNKVHPTDNEKRHSSRSATFDRFNHNQKHFDNYQPQQQQQVCNRCCWAPT